MKNKEIESNWKFFIRVNLLYLIILMVPAMAVSWIKGASLLFGWVLVMASVYLFKIIGNILVNQSLHVSKGSIIGVLTLKISLWILPIVLVGYFKLLDLLWIVAGLVSLVVSAVILAIKEWINARSA